MATAQSAINTNKRWLNMYLLALHTITPSDGLVWQRQMHIGNVHSPKCHQTHMQPSLCYKQNWNSSENMISCHSCIQVHRWSHYWRCCYLWCSVKGNQSHGHRPDRSCCCKHHQTVHVDTCRLTNISWHRAHDVVVWSINAMWIRCLFSWLVVITGHWDPAQCSKRPSWIQRFYIL